MSAFFVGFWVYAVCDRFPKSRSGHYNLNNSVEQKTKEVYIYVVYCACSL